MQRVTITIITDNTQKASKSKPYNIVDDSFNQMNSMKNHVVNQMDRMKTDTVNQMHFSTGTSHAQSQQMFPAKQDNIVFTITSKPAPEEKAKWWKSKK